MVFEARNARESLVIHEESKRLLMQAHLRSEKQGRPDEPRGSVAISSAEFQEFTREVAARIIQHHWKRWKASVSSSYRAVRRGPSLSNKGLAGRSAPSMAMRHERPQTLRVGGVRGVTPARPAESDASGMSSTPSTPQPRPSAPASAVPGPHLAGAGRGISQAGVTHRARDVPDVLDLDQSDTDQETSLREMRRQMRERQAGTGRAEAGTRGSQPAVVQEMSGHEGTHRVSRAHPTSRGAIEAPEHHSERHVAREAVPASPGPQASGISEWSVSSMSSFLAPGNLSAISREASSSGLASEAAGVALRDVAKTRGGAAPARVGQRDGRGGSGARAPPPDRGVASRSRSRGRGGMPAASTRPSVSRAQGSGAGTGRGAPARQPGAGGRALRGGCDASTSTAAKGRPRKAEVARAPQPAATHSHIGDLEDDVSDADDDLPRAPAPASSIAPDLARRAHADGFREWDTSHESVGAHQAARLRGRDHGASGEWGGSATTTAAAPGTPRVGGMSRASYSGLSSRGRSRDSSVLEPRRRDGRVADHASHGALAGEASQLSQFTVVTEEDLSCSSGGGDAAGADAAGVLNGRGASVGGDAGGSHARARQASAGLYVCGTDDDDESCVGPEDETPDSSPAKGAEAGVAGTGANDAQVPSSTETTGVVGARVFEGAARGHTPETRQHTPGSLAHSAGLKGSGSAAATSAPGTVSTTPPSMAVSRVAMAGAGAGPTQQGGVVPSRRSREASSARKSLQGSLDALLGPQGAQLAGTSAGEEPGRCSAEGRVSSGTAVGDLKCDAEQGARGSHVASILRFLEESERETAETAAPTSRGAQALPPCGPAPHASANGARDLPQGGVAASGHLPDTRDAADGDRSATLAAAVLGGIKERLARYEAALDERTRRVGALEAQLAEERVTHCARLEEAQAAAARDADAQRREGEAALRRHLEFIDRLLGDKEALAARCEELAGQAEAQGARHQAQVAAMRAEFVKELKRHKEAWAAAEQARRDAWSREREAEIKEATVRGLEPEVQRLVARHRGEVRRVEQAMREEHERERERLAEEHRAECRKLRQETAERVEEAVEREREAGAERARVAREAAEAAAAAQRTRLLGECDARVAEAEAARRAERDRAAAEVEACRAAADERVRQVRDALEEERRAGEARVRRALEVQAQEWEVQQEAWRQAVAERAKRALAEKEEELREQLAQQQRREIDAVADRLEREHADQIEQLTRSVARAHQNRIDDLMGEVSRLKALLSATTASQEEAEGRARGADEEVKRLRRALTEASQQYLDLERKARDAEHDWQDRAEAVRRLHEERASLAEREIAEARKECQELRARLVDAMKKMDDTKRLHQEQMAAVEARVRATVVAKDEAIARLRAELGTVTEQLRKAEDLCA